MIDFAVLQEATSLLVVFGLVTLVCAYLLVYAKVNLWLRAVLIPLILALTFVGYVTLIDVMGRPFPGLPPDRSTLISYEISIQANKQGAPQKYIVLWVYAEGDYRLYRTLYSRKLEEELIGAQDDAKNGKPRQQIKIGLEPDSSPIILYEIPWRTEFPKDGVGAE